MNEYFEIVEVEKDVNIYGLVRDVSVIKLSDNLLKELLFDLDVAILGDYKDEFWCKKWYEFFHALEYNVFYRFRDIVNEDVGKNDPMYKGFQKYFHENFRSVARKFRNGIPSNVAFVYHKKLNDYFQFDYNGKWFCRIRYDN